MEHLHSASRALLSRRPTSRAFVAIEKVWIVRAEDDAVLRERLAKLTASDDEERAHLRDGESALARLDGTFLMTLTKWKDLVWSVGAESDLAGGGVWRIVPYRKA